MAISFYPSLFIIINYMFWHCLKFWPELHSFILLKNFQHKTFIDFSIELDVFSLWFLNFFTKNKSVDLRIFLGVICRILRISHCRLTDFFINESRNTATVIKSLTLNTSFEESWFYLCHPIQRFTRQSLFRVSLRINRN